MEGAIALIGMSGAFSEASNIDEYWNNIKSGKECIKDLTEKDLIDAGIPSEIYNKPTYVKRSASLEEAKMFDPAFFGYTPTEARMMDPQHRIFLEHSWKCLEDGGYDPDKYDGLIGVYAGCSQNNYLLTNLINSNERPDSLEAFQMMLGNDKDYLTSKVSYKFNLKGPSMTIQTACSTSAVSIQQACLSLLSYQCDMALSGGCSINVPYKGGYEYKDGLIFSPDGHCRSFDADANGTVFGDGVGVLLLKRLEDALEEGDRIHALIRSSAINNDGSAKVSYTAPGVKSQAEAVATAIALAEVPTESIAYVEAHGTGTLLGDPIETAALTEAFRMDTEKKGFCVLGSVKPNIGHLDAGAGVAGVIKTVKMLQEGVFPPQVNFNKPNPALELENSPFRINRELSPWERKDYPRRAGVTSLGVGGTNVHLILEEYIPEPVEQSDDDEIRLLPLSAKSPESLRLMKKNLVDFLKEERAAPADISFTLQKGRKEFPYRDVLPLIPRKDQDYEAFLNTPLPREKAEKTPVVFLFSGQGSQYPDMGRELYEKIPSIRETMDRCFAYLKKEKSLNIKEILYPSPEKKEISGALLRETGYTQPALFILEYAVARYLQEFGIQPDYLLGHSLGEYTAACLAGVFSLEEALSLVAERGRIMQKALPGSMLSLALGERETQALIDSSEELQIAVVNSPGRCVVSGTKGAIVDLQDHLERQEIPCSLLKTSHAYHSFMMDSILEEFKKEVEKVRFNRAEIPLISNKTGQFAGEDSLSDPSYWVEQLRSTVRFSDGLTTLWEKADRLHFIEVGPGNSLCNLLRMHPACPEKPLIQSTVPGPKQNISAREFFLKSLGKMWQNGCEVDWDYLFRGEVRQKVSLPSYPFEHREYWVGKPCLPSAERRYDSVPDGENGTAAPVPQTRREQLVDIWRETFGIDDIHEESDFFELGGDSLLAVRLCDTLNKRFNKSISLGTLFEARTFSQQCKLIKRPEDQTADSGSLITLSRGEPAAPHLFCICGINIYQQLADAIGAPFTVSGLFLPVEQELFIHNKELPSLQEMAAMYKEIIRKTQPRGPYYIGGLSFGGILAYELARQLTEEGEQIRLLSIFDSKLPQEISGAKRISLHFRTFKLNSLAVPLGKMKRRVGKILEKIIGVKKSPKLEKTDDEELIDMRQVIYGKVVKKYKENMPSYEGTAHIFRALDSDPFEKLLYEDDLGWKDYMDGELSYHKIPGDHLSILEKGNVEKIAHIIREELAR
ncbi:MAG: beta-ketoacyl synthase N-terminal-like domain-containing protein [Spirochaetales bacterium]|nr:beta-ketoacyl synthase N-terminal-like domain-containing protein [Spirochaetales bacterium]